LNIIKKEFSSHSMGTKQQKYKNSEIYICPYCGSEVEVSDGNCWHCPNCGMGECGISEDMVVDENTRLIVKLFGPPQEGE